MGLAASQARLLMYTARKADCELRISRNSTEKMALAREQSKLTREYNTKINSKKLAYYANGSYHKIDYTYLMGKSGVGAYVNNDNYVKKNNYNMILTDSRGLVVLNQEYVNIITNGIHQSNKNLQTLKEGKPFAVNSPEFIEILWTFCRGSDGSGGVTKDQIKTFLDNSDYTVRANNVATKSTGEETEGYRDYELIPEVVDRISYYYPIVLAMATNGWTAEYTNQLNGQSLAYAGEDYIGDSIQAGTFNLAVVQEDGTYMPDTTLSFFTTTNEGIVENLSSDEKEKLTAWFNAEHDRISEKETYLDLEITDLSTELESIKTAIQSIESYTKDAITSIFDWGSG